MRSTRSLRGLALTAATALVAGVAALAPAAPAYADDFTAPVITGLPAAIPMTTADVPFTATFTGPPTSADLSYRSYDQASNGVVLTATDTNGMTSVYAPAATYQGSSSAITPGVPMAYTLSVNSYKTPGHYKMVVPIEMSTWNKTTYKFDKVDLYSSVEFDLFADPATILAGIGSYGFNGHGKFSKKAKWAWTMNAPDYLKGAKVTVYYQAKGKKKFAAVASATLNATGDAAFKGRKGAIRKAGKAYFVVGAVKYAAATKSGLYVIKKV